MTPPPNRPLGQHVVRRADAALVTPLGSADATDQTVRVVHVDDDGNLVEMAATFLERADEAFTVTTETTAQDVLERLDAERIDCIVSDYQMPGMDGLELLEAVREHRPDLPFILFTGKGSEEIASDAIARGVTDYMQKGPGTDQYEVLANRVRNAVDQYRTYEELWTTLSWYQRLVEQNVAGIYLVQDDELVYVNEKFAEIFGYTQEELIGKPALTLVDPADEQTVQENLRKREAGEQENIHYTWTGVRKNGNRIDVEVQGGAIEFNEEPAVMGLLLDVTGPSE